MLSGATRLTNLWCSWFNFEQSARERFDIIPAERFGISWNTWDTAQRSGGKLMDVTRIISELRLERQQIDQEIHSLEQAIGSDAGTTFEQPVAELSRKATADDGSS
jgi:hypothetical protein